MAKKKSSSRQVAVRTAPARDIVRSMIGGSELVAVDAVFHVPSVHPKVPGPWANEADKIAWTDPMSGLACIIRRSGLTGCLNGYVAVPPEHPLFGASCGATVGLEIQVHGNIDYAATCQRHEPEDVSICHVTPLAAAELYANDAARGDDDAWWFGFSCDQDTDVVPLHHTDWMHDPLTTGMHERVYRDEAFVYRECVNLAAQLREMMEGSSIPDGEVFLQPVLIANQESGGTR